MARARRCGGWAVHVGLAVVLTWPLALHLGDRLPLGTESSATVPAFNLWTLRWEADRFAHGLGGFWTAPIFHPDAGTLAFSEVQPLTAAVFAPISWLTGSPVLAYNLVLLGALALNGWAGSRLARSLGVATRPALLVGVLAQGLPFVLNELGVLQLVIVFPVLLLVERLIAWIDHGGYTAALGAAAALTVTFLTSVYYGLFAVVALVPFVLVQARPTWLTRPRAASAGAGLLLAAGTIGPFVLAQQHWVRRFTWSAETVRANSAALPDYLQLDPRAAGSRLTPWLIGTGGSGQHLFPGSVLLALAGLGGWWAWRAHERRRLVGAVGVAIAMAGLLSLGLRLEIAGVVPYELVRDHVPGFARLRSPFRMAVMVQALLLVPASLAVGWLWGRGRTSRRALVAVVALALVEVAILPMHLAPAPPANTDWSRWLAARPGPAAVAMVPFAPGRSAADFEPTVEAMLVSLDHGKPLVNGYSGFFPARVDQLADAMVNFPDGTSLELLVEAGVRWVVVDRSWLHGQRAEAFAFWSDRLVRRYGGRDAIVYELRP